MINLLNQNELKDVLGEMQSSENINRKRSAFQQLDIYSGNQANYVYAKIKEMYGQEAIDSIQIVAAINLAERISNAEASIYKEEPERSFTNATEKEIEQILKHYEEMDIDQSLMLLNRLYRLGNQSLLQIIPKNGSLMSRVLYQHQYDVIPSDDNPEEAAVYIISTTASKMDRANIYNLSDNYNQTIADPNDMDQSNNRFVVWSKDYNFICNGLGEIVSNIDEAIDNPIGILPFVDVSKIKTMGYFAGGGADLAAFSVAFNIMLTDLGEIVRLQGYSQGVLSSLEKPESISIGPNRLMWLKKDKNEPGDKDPMFNFVSPTPDLQGSMTYVENVLRMFLSSRGTDSKLVSTQTSKEYTSGFERLLSIVDRAEATKGDRVKFRCVEEDVFEITRAWNNYLYQTVDGLEPDNKISLISDQVYVNTKFYEPQQILTQQDKEDSIKRRMDLKLMSRLMAIQELYDVDEERAQEIIDEIDNGENETPEQEAQISDVIEDDNLEETNNIDVNEEQPVGDNG